MKPLRLSQPDKELSKSEEGAPVPRQRRRGGRSPRNPKPQKPGEKSPEPTGDLEGPSPANLRYVLKLYVAGLTPRSTAAIQSVKRTCEEYLPGRYELEVVDIYHHPTLAKGEQIIAAPTLIRKLPLPLRRLIGDMANQQRVLVGLDLQSRE